ncbi:MAG: hypothetical protein WC829_15350 [Hyphomicrobium sp.]|jgi:hypothetical protein
MRQILLCATLLIFVAMVLVAGITFIGLVPIVIFEDDIKKVISKLTSEIAVVKK